MRRSINKILVGKPELKHTNSKVIITVYIYNAEKNYYLNRINKIPTIFELNKKYVKEIRNTASSLKSKFKDNKWSLLTSFKDKKIPFNFKDFSRKINKYQFQYMKSFISKLLRKEMITIYFNQFLALNKAKFEKRYVSLLVKQINKIYNKNVEFNFVNLKYLYLDNYIFSTALITKIKKLSKIKKSFLVAIRKFLNMFDIPPVKPLDIYNQMYNKEIVLQGPSVYDFIFRPINNRVSREINVIQDIKQNNLDANILNKTFNSKTVESLDEICLKNYDILDKSVTRFLPKIDLGLSRNKLGLDLENSSNLVQVFKSTKYKLLNGVRIEVAGRITKRRSAARSIFKMRNKGNIRNKDSSDKGLSAVMFRGYAKSNLQYNFLYSKVRGGSFGFKGWLSGN